MNHPVVRQMEITGHPVSTRNPLHFAVDQTNCDVCPKYAAVVRFRGMSLCESCAGEERIVVL